MDPLIFELAKTFFAGISAVAAAVQVWYRFRDARKASATFDATYHKTHASPEASDAAEELVAIIPEDVIKDLEGRADAYWTGYRGVLGGGYLPDEIEKATEAVQACVCRELGRMYILNGSIPPRWEDQWQRYDCENRTKRAILSTSLSPFGTSIVSPGADAGQPHKPAPADIRTPRKIKTLK